MTDLLVSAIENDDQLAIKKLVRDKRNLSDEIPHPEYKSISVLAFAVIKDRWEICKTLIEANAPLHYVTKAGFNLLHLAAIHASARVAALLIQHQLDVNARNKQGVTVLHYAAWKNDKSMVNVLVDAGALIDDAVDADPLLRLMTPLHFAVRACAIDVVQCLLNHGANINAQDVYKGNALQIACELGSLEMVEILVKGGAELNARGRGGRTPMLETYALGNEEIFHFLKDKGAETNPAPGPFMFGKSALHFAAEGDSLEMVKWLVEEKKADINAKFHQTETPLTFACRKDQSKVAKYLIDNGADLTTTDRHARGESLLHEACWSENEELVGYLIAKGIKVNARDKRKQTPLHYAVAKKRLKTVKLLLTHGAKINARSDGCTPLHQAAYSDHVGILALLLTAGADINAKTDLGFNAQKVAQRHGSKSALRYLKDWVKTIEK